MKGAKWGFRRLWFIWDSEICNEFCNQHTFQALSKLISKSTDTCFDMPACIVQSYTCSVHQARRAPLCSDCLVWNVGREKIWFLPANLDQKVNTKGIACAGQRQIIANHGSYIIERSHKQCVALSFKYRKGNEKERKKKGKKDWLSNFFLISTLVP